MRKPRLALDPLAYKALRVWSALEDTDPDVLVGKLIFANMPERVRDAIGETAPMPPSPPGELDTSCKTEGEELVCEAKRKRLIDDIDAQAHIKELWLSQEPRLSYGRIAEAVGFPKGTVASHIKKLVKAGELPE